MVPARISPRQVDVRMSASRCQSLGCHAREGGHLVIAELGDGHDSGEASPDNEDRKHAAQ
jgi:hypothetical protein